MDHRLKHDYEEGIATRLTYKNNNYDWPMWWRSKFLNFYLKISQIQIAIYEFEKVFLWPGLIIYGFNLAMYCKF